MERSVTFVGGTGALTWGYGRKVTLLKMLAAFYIVSRVVVPVLHCCNACAWVMSNHAVLGTQNCSTPFQFEKTVKYELLWFCCRWRKCLAKGVKRNKKPVKRKSFVNKRDCEDFGIISQKKVYVSWGSCDCCQIMVPVRQRTKNVVLVTSIFTKIACPVMNAPGSKQTKNKNFVSIAGS